MRSPRQHLVDLSLLPSELFVSPTTVKTHCAAIYRKLGVGDRKAAVQTARDLGIL